MILLLDQNLSHRLPKRLSQLFPKSAHIRSASLSRAPDDQIWEYAIANGYCIVTQDSDFAERSRLYGAPPKVIWLRCGNTSPQKIEAILENNFKLICDLINTPDLHFIELI